MQTRVDAEIIVYSKTESVARISEIRCTKSLGKRVVNQNQNQKSELQTRQTGTRQNRNRKNKGVSCTISQYTGLHKSTQNKDQRSDGLTDGQTGVYIHWDIKHTKRIMGCEEGLNNYYGEGHTRIKSNNQNTGERHGLESHTSQYKYTAPIRE